MSDSSEEHQRTSVGRGARFFEGGFAAACLVALLWAGMAVPGVAGEDIFYDISHDPDELKLLALDTIQEDGGSTTIMMVSVYKKPKAGLEATWRIDCEQETMGIFQARQLTPDGAGEWADIELKPSSARSSPQSWTTFKLACTGAGDLVERKVYYGELAPILARYWGGE